MRQILVNVSQYAALHRLSTPELESHLKKMKHPQVVSICLDMASQLRSLEKLLCVQQQHSVRISLGNNLLLLTQFWRKLSRSRHRTTNFPNSEF